MGARLERTAGLTASLAAMRLREEGPNALPDRERRGAMAILASVLREPMFLLLIGACAVYLVLGSAREALVLAASMVVVVAITFVQERRTERALESLRDLSSPRALVIRDEVETRIAGREVVRGDLLVLREGDRVAADARLVEAHDLALDESLLTGESVPVRKHAHPGEGLEVQVFSGTLVVRGTGLGEVVATGPRSEIGRIGVSLARIDSGKTALEVETTRAVRALAGIAGLLCAGMALAYFLLRGDALAGILAGLTLAMSLMPEEFPVVLTVFLAIGAWRISRHGVLTRRLPAIETLGATTVLCCDKTGTLTENRMAVARTWTGESWREPGTGGHRESRLLAAAALACEPAPFDPMERALRAAAPHPARPGLALERRYPLGDGFLAVCHGWRAANGEGVAAIKGAPESVLSACHLDEAARANALRVAADAARTGMRLLAVAHADWRKPGWPDSPHAIGFEFLGLVALADPIRPSVPAAIADCRRAGIRVVMITGDHPETACAIAAQAGIDASRVLRGKQVATMEARALAEAARTTQVFARVRPEQKLALVQALRDAGEVVAMTGDGVNDAPALRAAHIGIAMGRRGTDVAREAAALVLLEDDFTAIVATVRLGRRIYDNIRNAMRFLVAVHVPLAGMAFIPLAAGWPLFFFPVHVVFMEFVIDPSCSLVFEAEREDASAMRRPPRDPAKRMFTGKSLAIGALLGASVLAAVAGVYGAALAAGLGAPVSRAAAFAALVCGNLGLILVNRSHELTFLETLRLPNPALWWIVAGTVATLLAVIHVPALAAAFLFAPPPPALLAGACAAGLACVAWYDLRKLFQRRRANRALV